jgi:DNA-binding beta-propeller fold protein YncE
LKLPAHQIVVEASAVAVDATGAILALHRGRQPLLEFDPGGSFKQGRLDGLMRKAHGLRLDPEGNMWVVDAGSHVVLKLSRAGQLLMVLGKQDKPGLRWDPYDLVLFDQPTDVAFGPEGEVFVSDGYGNARVAAFDRHGRFLRAWGRKGAAAGEFDTPHTIVVDPRGRVVVGDRENRRIQLFDRSGRHLETWDHVGSPSGLDMAADGSLWMVDDRAGRVLHLSLDGEVLGRFGAPGKGLGEFTGAHMLDVGPDGALYVAEVFNWRLQRLRPRGRP